VDAGKKLHRMITEGVVRFIDGDPILAADPDIRESSSVPAAGPRSRRPRLPMLHRGPCQRRRLPTDNEAPHRLRVSADRGGGRRGGLVEGTWLWIPRITVLLCLRLGRPRRPMPRTCEPSTGGLARRTKGVAIVADGSADLLTPCSTARIHLCRCGSSSAARSSDRLQLHPGVPPDADVGGLPTTSSRPSVIS
jgi:hypothetical protein